MTEGKVADTVLEQIAKLALGDDRLTEEEQAFIEAAKAKVATFGECPTALLEPEDADLRTAVEALKELP